VSSTALDRRPFPEHGADSLAKRLRAVDHAEDLSFERVPAILEVGEQVGGDRGVLASALPEASGSFVRSRLREPAGDLSVDAR